jgi:hypothetical protein
MSVMGVISGNLPHTYWILYMTMNCWVFGDRHTIVMVIVIEETA